MKVTDFGLVSTAAQLFPCIVGLLSFSLVEQVYSEEEAQAD